MGSMEIAMKLVTETDIGEYSLKQLRLAVVDNHKIFKAMKDPENIKKLFEKAAILYAELFTDEEIMELIAFQTTDTGRKALELTTTLVQRGSENAKEWLYGIMDQIEEEDEENIAVDKSPP